MAFLVFLLLFGVLSEELLFSVKKHPSNCSKKQTLDYIDYLKHYRLFSWRAEWHTHIEGNSIKDLLFPRFHTPIKSRFYSKFIVTSAVL